MFKTSGKLQLDTALQLIDYAHSGRQIYHISNQQQDYWLKLQRLGVSKSSEQAFLHELDMYQRLQHSVHGGNRTTSQSQPTMICLPYQIIDLTQFSDVPADVCPQALCLVDSDALFDELLDLSQVSHRMFQSLTLLQHLHQCGYLHGDLKTAHFRLRQQRCFLIDFEQCTAIDRAHSMRQTATPRYMAPELFHAEAKSVQSDIYALGVIWLEWLSQQRYRSRSYLDWAYWHCQQLEVALPQPLQQFLPILQMMLAKKQADRYSHIEQIKRDLLGVV